MKKSDKDIYCLAPWVHAYVNTLGKRELCCFKDFSLESVNKEDLIGLEEYWNSKKVRDIRLKMLSGVAPDSCYPCSSKVLYNDHPRNFFFDKYQDLKEEAAQSTDESGATTLRPRYLDYRFSNTCNFSCRMCSPGSSSKIESSERKIRPGDFQGESYNSSRESFNSDHVVPEFKALIDDGVIDQLYWGGGEPLLTEEHWELMEYAVEGHNASGIDVTYNTNLSVLSFKKSSLSDLLPNFREVKFLVSLDGVDKVGEYIREGMAWEKMKSNIDSIASIENASVKLTITITLPGLLYIEDLARYVIEAGHEYEVHICHANGPHDLMTPLILPRDILRSVVDKKLVSLKNLNSELVEGLIKNLELLKNRSVISEEYPENFDKRFYACRKYFLEKEPKTGINLQEILSPFPEVSAWWFRTPEKSSSVLNKYEKKFLELQLKSVDSSKGVQQVTTKPMSVNYALKEDHNFEMISSLSLKKSSQILITNDPNINDIYFDEVLESGDLLSLVIPAKNILNRFLNKSDTNGYELKTLLDSRLKNGIEGYEIVGNSAIAPWEFLFSNRALLRPFRFLGVFLDFVLEGSLCLHRHWLLRKL